MSSKNKREPIFVMQLRPEGKQGREPENVLLHLDISTAADVPSSLYTCTKLLFLLDFCVFSDGRGVSLKTPTMLLDIKP